jgi:two-component system sensor histidine kinase GlrK
MFQAEKPGDRPDSPQESHTELIQAKDELLEGLVHDLKNALASIVMNASLAKRLMTNEKGSSNGEISEKEKGVLQMIDRIQDATDRIHLIMQDSMDMSKCVSGVLAVAPTRRDVRILLGDALAYVEKQRQAKGIEIRLEPFGEGLMVQADHEKVPTALARLIGYGIKVSPASSTLEIGVARSDNHILIRMWLSSEIFHDDQAKRIFNRQGKKAGLYLVRGIAEAFGGRTWTKTMPGNRVELGMSLRDLSRDSSIRLLVQS